LFSPEEEGNWNLEGFMGKFRVWGEGGVGGDRQYLSLTFSPLLWETKNSQPKLFMFVLHTSLIQLVSGDSHLSGSIGCSPVDNRTNPD
jgi:hypothetical protein